MYNILISVLILLGSVFRIREYLANRSLHLDEANLALNLINRSFLELIKPLDPVQYAPLGFLWAERLTFVLFGDSEYSLRLFPLIISIISLPLFYKMAGYFLNKFAVLLALFLFAGSNALIYFSSEVKQYAIDVGINLILYLIILKFSNSVLTKKRILLLVLIGSISIWFSHPSIFILFTAGFLWMLYSVIKKNWNRVGILILISFCWILSFFIIYSIQLHYIASQKDMSDFWQYTFAPIPPLSKHDFSWYIETYLNLLANPLGASFPWIVLAIWVAGLSSIYQKNRLNFYLLILPVLCTLVASSLQKYPFVERFLLFLVPNFLIISVSGIEGITRFVTSKLNFGRIRVSGSIIFGLLIFNQTIYLSFFHFFNPQMREEIKPVMEYLSRNRQKGDGLYLYYASVPAYTYYAPKFNLSNIAAVKGVNSRNSLAGYIKDLKKMKGSGRVWFIFSHDFLFNINPPQSEEQFFINYLDSIGKRLDDFPSYGASIYLYDLK